MSNLSWLNPTPHAIAVYASRPLSPVAAQHSLPSGRYSLLGPDFHRLDRTSLRLAHSFDHLVGAGDERRRQLEAECIGGFQVDCEVELRWQFDGQVRRVRALQDSVHVAGGAPEQVRKIRPVGDESAGHHALLRLKHRRQPVLCKEVDDAADVKLVERIVAHQNGIGPLAHYRGEGGVDHHPCKARFRLAGSPLPGGSRTLRIATKGFRSQSHPPFLDLSWRKGSFILNLPLASRHSITSSAGASSVGGTVEAERVRPAKSCRPLEFLFLVTDIPDADYFARCVDRK